MNTYPTHTQFDPLSPFSLAMSAPAAAAAAAAAGPLPSWEQIEREANKYANDQYHMYATPYSRMQAILALTGSPPLIGNARPEDVPANIHALINTYALRPFEAFVHVRYPHVDQTTAEFQYSALISRMSTASSDRNTNELALALGMGGARAIEYIVDSSRLDLSQLRAVIRALGPMIGKSSLYGYAGHGTELSTNPLMRALETRVRYLANPRAAIASSRVYDVLSARSGGPHLAQYAATFADPSFGREAEDDEGWTIRRPLQVRTHLGELQRIRAEMAATVGVGSSLTPQQLLERVSTTKHGLDELIESIEKRKKK